MDRPLNDLILIPKPIQLVKCNGYWNDEDPKLEKDYLNQSRVLYKFMTNYVSKNPRGTFLNYRDLDIGVMTGTDKNAYNSAKVYGKNISWETSLDW
ncbi:berberine/berberine-like, FAD-binding, type 2 [Artemisia annua]|uniref:Berberine/berberine-like, FAD-binding, type 2 n=1 Tax=Artemisia annua TaxID=35608 RepID=A0A2U1KHR7_ARTAN|nr:berberine/berberine-like, FAD-binding, type 2 [Artemisia annua]